ncbi:MAG: hypothetical protein ACOVVK_19625 [Elsteraceae bacterium]
MQKSFIELCLSGEKRPDDVDDFIETWHSRSSGDDTLREALGLSVQEYSMWLAAPETLADIVVNRKSNNSKIVIDGAYIRS